MTEYPARLHHNTPGWVREGSAFHIRLRIEPASLSLTDPVLGVELLRGVQRYHQQGRWWCELVLLMPDHAHAILAFPRSPGMSEAMRNWKRATTRLHRVRWQEGYFDHRLRTEAESNEKWHYIRRNPVAKTLCATEDEWRWWWSAVVPNPLLSN